MWEIAGGILIAALCWPAVAELFDLNGARAADRRFQEDLDRANAFDPVAFQAEMDQLLKCPPKQTE